MKFAKQAWNFLYSQAKEFADERWFVCMLAAVDPEALEARMAVANIPEPTYETLKNAWTQLELAYWRLGGCVGEKPVARPENVRTERGTNRRHSNGFKVNRNPSRRLTGDRRDAGKARPTLLFRPPGVPVFPKFAGTAMHGVAGSARQLKFAFGS